MSNYRLFVVTVISLIALLVACGAIETEPGGGEPAATATPEATPRPTEAPATETPVGPGAEEGVAVVYEVSGGIAGLREQYVIYANGFVDKKIGPPEGDQPVQTFEVGPERVTRLLAMLGQAGFFELEGDYIPENPIYDGFQHVITATLGDQTTRIRTIDAADETELPPAVTESVVLVEAFVAELGG
ncbi:MAG: hypothetical protein L0322_29955 [Chloroflexi bacterium]|nr:hypothetical protein [Chloroflexota bacterium]